MLGLDNERLWSEKDCEYRATPDNRYGQDVGRMNPDRPGWLRRILAEFRRKHQVEPRQRELKNQLQAASAHEEAIELLRQLQNPY